MERIEGYVDHIIYRNQDNGYTVMNVIADGEEITCVGLLHYIGDGELVEITGHYKDHATYGRQLQIETLEIKAPEDELSIERYLGSGAVKGIGVSSGSPGSCGSSMRTPSGLWRRSRSGWQRSRESASGKAREIAEQVEEKKDMRKAMIFLQQYGISTNTGCKDLLSVWTVNIYQVIKENPYQMADDIDGVGFRIADEIAAKAGIHTDSDYPDPVRNLLYVLQQAAMRRAHLSAGQSADRPGQWTCWGSARRAFGQTSDGSGQLSRKLVLKAGAAPETGACVYSAQAYYLELNAAKMLCDLNIPVLKSTRRQCFQGWLAD